MPVRCRLPAGELGLVRQVIDQLANSGEKPEASGHPRATQTASDLGVRRLTLPETTL